MYSGDEEVSDAESVGEDYDHDFEAEELCVHCDEVSDNCQCEFGEDSDLEEEYYDSEECAVCGMGESDPAHG
jgi:hypothetical protein